MMLFLSETLCRLVFFCYDLIWFDLSSLLLFPLLTFDLSDFETSVDSRCTTDSADSAFIGRRYWFLASSFSPFLSSNHPLPSPPTQEVRLQISLQDNKDTDFSFIIVILLMFCCPSLCFLVIYINSSPHLSVPTSISPHYSPITFWISVLAGKLCLYSCLSYYMGSYDSSNMYYSYFLLSRHLICVCVFCLHTFKAELHDAAHS